MLDTKRRCMVLDLVIVAVTPLWEIMALKDKAKTLRGVLLEKHVALMARVRACTTMPEVAELVPLLRDLDVSNLACVGAYCTLDCTT